MMSERLYQAMLDQIQAELASAYLYLGMSMYFEEQNLPGFARWMWHQYLEEQEHAHKFIRHLVERGKPVTLKDIPAPEGGWDSPLAVFEAGLAHEQEVTRRIKAMYEMALEDKDYQALPLLHWFLEEQIEEEDIFRRVVDDLRRIGNDPAGLIFLDREMGRREGDDD